MVDYVREAFAICLLFLVYLVPVPARAEEPWLLSAEATAAQPLTQPQRSLFRTGFSGSLALHRPVVPWLAIGVRFRYGYLFNGSPPADPGRVDPGAGTLLTGAVSFVLRPLAFGADHDPRRGTGLWIEGAGGAGLTGDLWRGTVEVGVGWGIQAGAVDLSPVVRYVQVVEPPNALDGRDARILLAGLQVTLFDARPVPVVPKPPPPPPPPKPPPPAKPKKPGDRDHDGIPDNVDKCPDQPEDFDGFQDQDGCPDPDNDGDGIPDVKDKCPNQPETVNGIDDQDGCPDKGLIQLINDRIVLEERVLFDRERSRVKRTARPILDAIVRLWRQHPEWARLRVEGFADQRGPAAYNMDLSTRRARNVMKALISRGIPADMIEYKGYGKTHLRDPRYNQQAFERNRRVEIVVVARKTPEMIEEGTVNVPPVKQGGGHE